MVRVHHPDGTGADGEAAGECTGREAVRPGSPVREALHPTRKGAIERQAGCRLDEHRAQKDERLRECGRFDVDEPTREHAHRDEGRHDPGGAVSIDGPDLLDADRIAGLHARDLIKRHFTRLPPDEHRLPRPWWQQGGRFRMRQDEKIWGSADAPCPDRCRALRRHAVGRL